MKYSRFAVAFAIGFAGSAFAQEKKSSEGQTKIKIEDTKEKNKVSGDIDTEITNAKLRAESGSKSKWSLSTPFRFTGGSINQAFGQKRPNLSGQPGNEVNSSMSIDPSVRYRWSKNYSTTLGTSMAILTPFQGRTTKKQFNFRDPSIRVSRVGKVGNLQSTGDLAFSFGTSNESKDTDTIGALSLSTSLLTTVNRLSLGLAFAGAYSFYHSAPGGFLNKDTVLAKKTKQLLTQEYGSPQNYYGGDTRNQVDIGLYPFLEYSFNDRFSFRTVFGYFNWQHLYGDPNDFRLLRTFIYQSMGVGITVTRDIYLYPNVQFVPDNIRSDFTNVALTANLNMF